MPSCFAELCTLVSGAGTAAGRGTAREHMRSAESLEAAAESMGPAAGRGGAALGLGAAEGCESAAEYDLVTAGVATAQDGSW